jgi:tetratricopeptide (TPR) repeat protein
MKRTSDIPSSASVSAFAILLALAATLCPAPAAVAQDGPDNMAAPATAVAESAPSAAERIARAQALTGQGQTREALAVYLEVATENPEAGIPALGRFLSLVDFETEREEFVKTLLEKDSSLDLFVRARGLVAVGQRDQALELLNKAPELQTETDGRIAFLLNSLLRNAGRMTEADQVLVDAMVRTEDDETQTLLFKKLFSGDRLPLVDRPSSLTLALDLGFEAWQPLRREWIQIIDPAILWLGMQPDYFERRDALEKWVPRRGVPTVCFFSRLLQREERFEDAVKFLRECEARFREDEAWALIAEELSETYRNLGRVAESRAIVETLVKRRSGRAAANLAITAAGLSLAQNDLTKAIEMLEAVDAALLKKEDLRLYYRYYLATVSRIGDPNRILSLYGEIMDQAHQEQIDLVHMLLFSNYSGDDQLAALDRILRRTLEEDPEASPHFWRLAAEIADRIYSPHQKVEALYNYVQALPGNYQALELLAEAVMPVALEFIPQAREGTTSLGEEELETLVRITEEVLTALIRARPVDPTYYGVLIQLYETLGKDESEIVAAPSVVTRNTRNPNILAVAAFALATHGYPEKALDYYDRALEMVPEDMGIRMNRAASLTRLGRWEEAVAFYRTLLEQGQFGRDYHVHELIERLWLIDKSLGKEDEGIEYFRMLETRIQGDWIDEALQDVAALMATEERIDVAEEFYRKLMARAETELRQAELENILANLLSRNENHARAEQVLREAAERFRHNPDLHIDFLIGRADSLVKLRRENEAIELLQDLYKRHPEHPDAWGALYAAARLAQDKGDLPLATQLYEAYLATPTTSFGLRRDVGTRLEDLRSKNAEAPAAAAPIRQP